VLDGVCAALAILAAWLLLRQMRSRHALVESTLRFHEERAAEMERFSGRVAHDIRNPLQAARLAADLASRKSSEPPVRELAARVMRSLSRADTITTALLEFARSGAQPEPGARTDVGAVVEETIGAMAPEAASSGIDLRANPVPPVLAACSEGVYASLLGNLVRNAMKYMGPSETRRIVVDVTRTDGVIRTRVEDTGPGISAALLPSLFEPYFRASRGTAEGLGLGLATVKKLAESHGGSVGARSEVGRGSTFWFELPAAGLADTPSRSATTTPTQASA
jgi:signal transduction histidine kinase